MPTAPNWNFGDILDALDASLPRERAGADPRGRRHALGRLRAPLEQPRRAASRARRAAGRQGRLLPAQPARVQRGARRLLQGAARARERELPLPRRRALVHLRQLGREGRRLRRRVRRPRREAAASACRRSRPGCRSAASRSPSRSRTSHSRTQGAGAPLGIARAGEDLLFLYTGGTTGMPKGVMWAANDLWHALGAGVNAPANARQAARHARGARRERGEGGTARQADPVLSADARHGPVHRDRHVHRRRLRRDARRATSSSRPSSSTPSQRHQVNSLVIVGDAFAKPDAERARRESGPLGHLVGEGDRLVGRDVEPRGEAGPAAPQPRHDPDRLVRLVRSGRLRLLGHDRGRRGRRPPSS